MRRAPLSFKIMIPQLRYSLITFLLMACFSLRMNRLIRGENLRQEGTLLRSLISISASKEILGNSFTLLSVHETVSSFVSCSTKILITHIKMDKENFGTDK